jgi:hypothetical protein
LATLPATLPRHEEFPAQWKEGRGGPARSPPAAQSSDPLSCLSRLSSHLLPVLFRFLEAYAADAASRHRCANYGIDGGDCAESQSQQLTQVPTNLGPRSWIMVIPQACTVAAVQCLEEFLWKGEWMLPCWSWTAGLRRLGCERWIADFVSVADLLRYSRQCTAHSSPCSPLIPQQHCRCFSHCRANASVWRADASFVWLRSRLLSACA